jgi:hypothetical protein
VDPVEVPASSVEAAVEAAESEPVPEQMLWSTSATVDPGTAAARGDEKALAATDLGWRPLPARDPLRAQRGSTDQRIFALLVPEHPGQLPPRQPRVPPHRRASLVLGLLLSIPFGFAAIDPAFRPS